MSEVDEVLRAIREEVEALVAAAEDRGYSAGWEQGREDGHPAGYEEGYEEGRKAGYNEGHIEGYEEGRESASD